MIDLLWSIGVSNLVLSLALALIALGVQRAVRAGAVVHLAWACVLLVLVTPPLVSVPLVPIPSAFAAEDGLGGLTLGAAVAGEPAALAAFDDMLLPSEAADPAPTVGELARRGLPLVWILGSVVLLALSLARAWRFHRHLQRAASPAPPEVVRMAASLASRLGMRRAPRIEVVAANLTPMVWWPLLLGGRATIILPASLLATFSPEKTRWILAHELAHVSRRDHWVRWIEWAACVGFWWNPVTWLARKYLRRSEEVACDALVLHALRPSRHAYASSLLDAIELVAQPALRPPSLASTLNSGGALETRLTMILSSKTKRQTPRWITAGMLVGAIGLVPLGVAETQEHDRRVQEKREHDRREQPDEHQKRDDKVALEKALDEIEQAIRAGKISKADGEKKLAAIKEKLGGKQASKQDARRAELEQKIVESRKLAEEGKLTRDSFERRIAELEREYAHLAEREAKLRAEQDMVRRLQEMEALVAAGRMSKQEFAKAAEEMKKAMKKAPRRSGISEAQLKQKAQELEDRMAAGLMSQEQYDDAMRELHAAATPAKRGITVEDYKRAEAEMKELVASGRLSGKDADARLAEMREMVVKTESKRVATKQELAVREIEAALAAGKLSPEEARAKIESILKGQKTARAVQIEAEVQARVDQMKKMVAEGKLSPEEFEKGVHEMKRMLADVQKREAMEQRDAQKAAELRDRKEAERRKSQDHEREVRKRKELGSSDEHDRREVHDKKRDGSEKKEKAEHDAKRGKDAEVRRGGKDRR